jgi:flagellar biosynthesis GTPase FlhF
MRPTDPKVTSFKYGNDWLLVRGGNGVIHVERRISAGRGLAYSESWSVRGHELDFLIEQLQAHAAGRHAAETFVLVPKKVAQTHRQREQAFQAQLDQQQTLARQTLAREHEQLEQTRTALADEQATGRALHRDVSQLQREVSELRAELAAGKTEAASGRRALEDEWLQREQLTARLIAASRTNMGLRQHLAAQAQELEHTHGLRGAWRALFQPTYPSEVKAAGDPA